MDTGTKWDQGIKEKIREENPILKEDNMATVTVMMCGSSARHRFSNLDDVTVSPIIMSSPFLFSKLRAKYFRHICK